MNEIDCPNSRLDPDSSRKVATRDLSGFSFLLPPPKKFASQKAEKPRQQLIQWAGERVGKPHERLISFLFFLSDFYY